MPPVELLNSPVMVTADPSQALERGLESLLEFESVITELIARFVYLDPGEVDVEIQESLGHICEVLDLDLAILWQWSAADPGVIYPTHFYPPEVELDLSEPMSDEQYPWYREQMFAGRTIAISSLDELPAEAAIDRQSGEALGIQSNLCLPLTAKGSAPIGALALNSIREPRDWPPNVTARLQLLAQVITNALARKLAGDYLRKSEERLRAGADLAGLGYYEVDLEKKCVYADDRFLDLCGVPLDGSKSLAALEHWMEHLHPEDRDDVMRVREQLHDGTKASVSVEYRYLHPVEGERWLTHRGECLKRDATGRAVFTFGVVRDVTVMKRAEESLRALSRRLIYAHEEERALLARELHDDVTQRLAVLAIDVSRAELGAGEDSPIKLLTKVREELVRLSEDVHVLAYQLHPSVLEELGLNEALRAECGRMATRSGVKIITELTPEPINLGKAASLCLFRLAQESLNNMSRHSGASSATVTLQPMEGGWLLAIRDDGVGFDPGSKNGERSLGLASMRERIQLANGTLDIESAKGHGTSVVAWVPGDEESR